IYIMLANTLLKSIEKNLFYGQLTVTLPNNDTKIIQGSDFKLDADIKINNLKAFIASVIKRGDIGFGESYIEGHWETTNLTNLLILLGYNLDYLSSVSNCSPIWTLIFKIINFFRSNSKKRSEKNISAHYNIGNDFYQL